MQSILVDNAKVMAKGQVTLPKDIRDSLGIKTGDRVTFIRQGSQVIMMNSATYALNLIQNSMAGEAAKAGFVSVEDVDDLINEMREESVSKRDKS